jgi:hypothetical protein
MLNGRTYMVDSGLVSIGGTSATPALYFSTPSTGTLALAKMKVSVEGVSSPAPPSNGSVFFALCVVTGTQGGGGAVTPAQTSGPALAAQSTWESASSSALTGLTQSTEVWPATVPFTAGASWSDDFENTGLEPAIAISSKYAVYFTAASGAGSGCSARVVLWFAE